MRILDRDSRGYALSLDILLALIPLTLILGMVAADMDSVFYQMEDAIFRGSTERVAADTVSTLLETSGTPINWETTNSSGSGFVPGLARYDQNKKIPDEGTISSAKLGALNLAHLQNMVGPEYGVYMTVYNLTSNGLNDAKLKELGTYNSSVQDIIRIEKVATYSKLNVVSEIVGEIRGSNNVKTYMDPPYPFQTSAYINQTYAYYIVFENSGYLPANVNVTINGNNINFTDFNPKEINSNFLNTTSTGPVDNTVRISAIGTPGTWINIYIVQVTRNPPSPFAINLQNTKPEPCRLELFLWTK
ncbi:MAG: hypothetical protein Q8M92_10640 [Candidatus Subteraquimicrobiales bacterium]|nr:hypothetical protein [Candidatus Subteraquimicrobiales bacterium]